ncbi:LysE family translocator [Cyanobacteria bacterium FACHB-471]|nr:LysE family translocator [Cyanobacteria bacterium FACHB-471]
MPNLPQLYLFSVASLVILLMPGPAVLYVIVQSIKQGRMTGIIAVLGLEFGTFFHVLAAAFGISALLSSSITVFNLLKFLGTAYLIYLGICKLLPFEKMQHERIDQHESLKQIFWQGVMVELFNPKTMLFFFAFLPQFVTPIKGRVALQMLTLGLLFIGLAIVIDLLYAMLAGSVGHLLRDNRWFMRRHRYVESSVYIGLGVVIALSGSQA